MYYILYTIWYTNLNVICICTLHIWGLFQILVGYIMLRIGPKHYNASCEYFIYTHFVIFIHARYIYIHENCILSKHALHNVLLPLFYIILHDIKLHCIHSISAMHQYIQSIHSDINTHIALGHATFRCITYTTLRYFTFYYVTLHYITLHYITFYTYIELYICIHHCKSRWITSLCYIAWRTLHTSNNYIRCIHIHTLLVD